MIKIPDILQKIVEHKRQEVAAAMAARPLAELKVQTGEREDRPCGFTRAIADAASSGWTAVIAEVKKGSPSKGVIREGFDPLEIALTYQENGATCLSVLTDERFFLGHLGYLSLIREQVSLPLLRKDFLFHPYQVYEAYAAGADAVLLIAAMLEAPELLELHALATELGLDVLLEVHDEEDLGKALQTPCGLIGINNRDLRSFVTDLSVTERLLRQVPRERLVVTESGINTRGEVERLAAAGAAAFLIGESLMREEDIGAKLRELLGTA
ncbi:MAG TPA: indole-3-glycerol phosphate synthase TrpC [Verrucomicrobiae bacterium]|nr:indole-3-glycerol phosphate synthase TrpC [Verrucomicrobiae bacterium]